MYRKLYCCNCQTDVKARLTDGSEIYPHREDLAHLPFWKHDACGGYVGCHHKTAQRTRPLGNIPSHAMKGYRQRIHAIIDPIWKQGRMPRREIYAQLSSIIGREYHTAELRTEKEAKAIIEAIKIIRDETATGENQ